MNERVYLHEYVDIVGQGRAKYFEHMTKGWAEHTEGDRPIRHFGIWGTLGSTGRWPEVVNLWEFDSWAEVARHFSIEVDHPSMQDEKLQVWWREALEWRSGGFDRMLIPADYSPSTEQLCADADLVGAKVFYHERISVAPGQAKTYLALLEQEWVPVARSLGLHLVGAYRTAMRNDSECIVIWALREWSDWGAVEVAYESDHRVAVWRRRTQGLAIDWVNHLMVSAPLSPTQTGRLP